MDKFLEIILATLPYLTIGFGFALFSGLVKICKFWGSAEEKFKNVDSVNLKFDVIKTDISVIKGAMRLLSPILGDRKDDLLRAQSPINLTEKGENLTKELDLKQSIAMVWDKISQKIGVIPILR